VIPSTMRVARLYGVADLRVESVPVPVPRPGEVLVQIEACGVCPTDARKYALGVNDEEYPFNPGHEWVGRVEATGDDVEGMGPGERVYGDTYTGYAEYATIGTRPDGMSRGALPIGELPTERAVFVEPLADCLHAVQDQARLSGEDRVAVIGAGAMGLQMTAVAARAGARVLVVEPRADRRAMAKRFGADLAVAADSWQQAAVEWADGNGPDAVIVMVGRGEIAADAVRGCAPGGRVILFAGFGSQGVAPIDLNRLHYEEISLVGSEWVGVPPHQRLERYDQARELLAGGELPVEDLVSDVVGLGGVDEALRAVREQRSLKTVVYPGARE
jgi:L-iditol 2-dehydrogenase